MRHEKFAYCTGAGKRWKTGKAMPRGAKARKRRREMKKRRDPGRAVEPGNIPSRSSGGAAQPGPYGRSPSMTTPEVLPGTGTRLAGTKAC